jgi:hypothetical protein
LAAHPAPAQADGTAATFWKAVQVACNRAAAKPAGKLGRRIAQTAIDEFTRFDGHQIDSNGRLFYFGLTEAEHEEDDGGVRQAAVGHLGWWQVMKYWRTLFGDEAPEKLEVRGYRDASTLTQGSQDVELLRTNAARLLHEAESVTDPAAREILREAALRATIIDTSWSAAFVSYVVRESGVDADSFRFANAHRVYIYDAFATSAAELKGESDSHLYRACPLSTRPRVGDLICQQREPMLADLGAVRERIREEIDGGGPQSVRRTHCELVAHVDVRAQKMYSIGGNVNQSVSARKMNLRTGRLEFLASQKGHCGGAGSWTLPKSSENKSSEARTSGNKSSNKSSDDKSSSDKSSASALPAYRKCSLNDRKWFVLLQLR